MDMSILEYFLLTEADDEMHEPTEKDVPVGDNNGEQMEDPSEELNAEDDGSDPGADEAGEDPSDELDFDEEGGESEGDPSSSGDDMGTGGDPSSMEKVSLTGENTRKLKLLKQYKKLYFTTENLIELTEKIIKSSIVDDRSKKLFEEMKIILIRNKEKISKVTGTVYLKTEYKKLLTVFLYIKMTILNYSDILRKFLT